MSSKAALKAVRTAIDSKDFQLAADKAVALTKQEPRNYHAHVFLGLALDKLGRNDEAEEAYLSATRLKHDEKTAWQGLINLYEKQGISKLERYHEAVLKLGHIFAEADDKARGQDLVDKYIGFARKNGTRAQLKRALELHLPTGPLYGFLEGRVPHPSHTYLRLIEITESEEKEFINHEIGERRTRLGARVDQVIVEVKREAYKRGELEQLYRGIINWSHDDETRRRYEEKLLQRAYEVLAVLPSDQKGPKREEVLKAARDMVIIKHPYELAWKLVLEWQDVESFLQWDLGFLKDFIEFFPEDGLSKVLRGFLTSSICPFPREPDSDEGDPDLDKELALQDRLILMTDGLELVRSSIVAHRIMAELYLSLEEFESTVDVARKGLENTGDLRSMFGLDLTNTRDALNTTLANALISYQSPRHHVEAREIFETILRRKPTSTDCLLGVGLILTVDEDYAEAVTFLERALARDPSNIKVQAELAWCVALNGDLQRGLQTLRQVLSAVQASQPDNREFRAEILYRIGYCQWELDASPSARKDRSGAYASFLASIQVNMNYAPAYTSLGIYYSDYKKDKTRARRCFHKAFELSSTETEAAERLARAFADDKEWELVEAVAQRVVDSGKAKPAPGSKRRGLSWPYAALGTVQISKQQYTKSIVSFQAALRISPDDYHSWVGLGESYHHSGRYNAATKAFEHAQSLETNLSSDDREHVWFAWYMLANVKRELGEYDDAISRYKEVLRFRPGEAGVVIALLQTLTENMWRSIELGLFNIAAELGHQAIEVAVGLAQDKTEIFNLWKAVGDACAAFSYIKLKASKMPFGLLSKLLTIQLDHTSLDILEDIDGVGSNTLSLLAAAATSTTGTAGPDMTPANFCVYAAILAFKRGIQESKSDTYAQAVAWYNLGWSEYRAFRSLELSTDKKKAKRQPRKFIKAAIGCFKRAIELEAGNSEFWNALGVVTATLSPKVAQHAFVRSLHLNERNVQAWTNLGTLYLLHNDLQLANEALTRAQSTDPDYAQAWVGQGLLALLVGDAREARGLFEHGFDISDSSSVLAKRQYAFTVFDYLQSDATVSNEIAHLIQPFFALHQLRCQTPSDLSVAHLSALLAERIGEYVDAKASLRTICAELESEYEMTESASSMGRFAQANADLARILLAQQEFKEAAERAETALGLTSSGAEEETDFNNSKLRLSAHLTAGLAFYYMKSMDRAIEMFRDALQEAENAPEVVCLLAQVLWAKGGEEERMVARHQLFDCVEEHPDHVGAVTLLGAIALLDADEDAIDAVQSDLEQMRTRDDLEIHDMAKLTKLLTAISTLGLAADPAVPEAQRRIGEATEAVMICPGQPQGWMELSAASQESGPAEMAVQRALQCVPPRGNLHAVDLAQAYEQTGKAGDALRAIMLAPWRKESWAALSQSVSC